MQGPQATYLDGGARLHLHHGPIDLIIGAEGVERTQAFEAARARFETVLTGLVSELPLLRAQAVPGSPAPHDPVARRMARAVAPFCGGCYVTPMSAVAGSVADEVLSAMTNAANLSRAYVNNGGDIAVHLDAGHSFCIAMSHHNGTDLGRVELLAQDTARGIATSGAQGRSFSLGIADSVTVLARDAAAADVAATLIANAVDLPAHPGIQRQPANMLSPDSDLGDHLVVTDVPALSAAEAQQALSVGRDLAEHMQAADHIHGAALFLQGQNTVIGEGLNTLPTKELAHA